MSDWVDITVLPRGADGTNGTNGADGVKGDRYHIYAEPQSEGSDLWDLYRVNQSFIDGAYVNTGIPVLMVQGIPTGTGGGGGTPEVLPFVWHDFLQPDPETGQVDIYASVYNYNTTTHEITEGEVIGFIGSVFVPTIQGEKGEDGEKGEKGDKGDKGDVGASGNQTVVIYNGTPQLPPEGAYVGWSSVARRLADYYAYLGLVQQENNGLGEVISGLYRLGTFYAPTSTLFEIFGLYTPEMIAAMYDETNINNAAIQIFCRLVQNRQLTNNQLGQISAALPDPRSLSASPSQAATALTAAIFEQARLNGEAFRALCSTFRLTGGIENDNIDYTVFTNCAPSIEDWNHVFDFQIDAQGWQSGIYSTPAVGFYIAGEGWNRSVTTNPLGIHFTFPNVVNLLEIEVQIQYPRTDTTHRIVAGGGTGENPYNLTEDEPNPEDDRIVLAWQGAGFTMGSLSVQVDDVIPQTRVARVSIAGRGYNPF